MGYFGRIYLKCVLCLIAFYQKFISPQFGYCCRFYPSCSEYFREALIKHGFLKGQWLGVKRLIRCHPFCCGGFDPVP